MADNDVPGVGLAEAIEKIRLELQTAAAKGANQPLAFEAGPVEIEFEVMFSHTGGVDGGIHVWVVSLGAKGEATEQRTQRLKVSLQPINRATGEKSKVADVGQH